MATLTRAAEAEVRERLTHDTEYFAKHCLKIVDRDGEVAPLLANGPQARFDAALERQRADGEPMRAIICKARKLGFSTWTQAKLFQRVTQRENEKALVIAQDNDTASELFRIGQTMWAKLPDDKPPPFDDLKPALVHKREGKYLGFGEPSQALRSKGIYGLNSSLEIDTAKEFDAGRGYTFRAIHASEVAFWPDTRKLTALLNSVPDRPETLVVIESTANGHNHFKDRWDRAWAGESGYAPIFAAWWEEPSYAVRFHSQEDREEFVDSIGTGPYGDDEPRLIEQFDCSPEQLAWRRRMVVDQCEADTRIWDQEYPASPEDAFMATGAQVFSMPLVKQVIARTEETDPRLASKRNPGPKLGSIEAGDFIEKKVRSGMVKVPLRPSWKASERPRAPFWRVWEHPKAAEGDEKAGRYVVAVDPAGGEQTDDGQAAWHAIQVVNHRTREQAAEYHSREDPDLLGIQAYLAALHYNKAWLAIETTGGYGLFMARRIWRDFNYPFVYRRKSLERRKEKHEDRLGWDTNRTSKVILEDGMREMLREGNHGVKSRLLAMEMTTYVKDQKGKTGPEVNRFSDLLMAYMIAQQVAQDTVIPTEKRTNSTSTRGYRDPVTGY